MNNLLKHVKRCIEYIASPLSNKGFVLHQYIIPFAGTYGVLYNVSVSRCVYHFGSLMVSVSSYQHIYNRP